MYHRSDFNRKANPKYLSGAPVICDQHPEIDLTSISIDEIQNQSSLLIYLKQELNVIKRKNAAENKELHEKYM